MIREVDLASYLPPFMDEFKEIDVALKAENPEIMLVWKALDRVLQNEFIETDDEYGISRFEKILGIFSSADEDLETRRIRVKNRWFTSIPYTLLSLKKKIKEIFGNYDFTVYINSETYELTLIVYAMDNSQKAELEYIISTMVPVNVKTNIIYEDVADGSIYFRGTINMANIIKIKQRRA